jgi:aryl-alcohol dehydrogenase-like predicted oxidoreductase
MRYRSLGSTGIQVSTYCLGTMMFGPRGNPDHDACVKTIHRALDAGINFVDTADVYSRGESETILGKALVGRRDHVVVATKANGPMGDDPNERGNSRRWIIHEVEQSLRRLGTDWIDLYQMHRPDPQTDIAETLSALSDLVHQGKIRAFGCSTFPAERIVEAHWAAERHGLERFRTEQPPYSIFVRAIERSVLPTVQKYGMGALVWSPLASGWLTGRYRADTKVDLTVGRPAARPAAFDPANPENRRRVALVEELEKIAAGAGISLTHLAIAFTLAHPAVTSAILGPRTMEQLDDLIAGAEVTLSDDVLDAIDAVNPPGTNVSEKDLGWEPPSITDPSTRRRPLAERSAA